MLLSLPVIKLQVICWNLEQNSQNLNSHQSTEQYISVLLQKFISLLIVQIRMEAGAHFGSTYTKIGTI